MSLPMSNDYAKLTIDGCSENLQINDIVNEKFKLIDFYRNSQNGYAGYAYQNLITAGMTLNAEIEIGKRRIIEFFVYPIIKSIDEGVSVR